ncbi:Pimeloyl-ACP methyl ester carboxylesterase [Tistlia consotensis]|uniref:Pimeloyl-ACP methyl ester carboxylesterase n=1 Tax=Tistlia consotensis USBA 355 TaxID=560819 RepID=A0A1Y6CWX9_9PROT|nr:alpha/beta hydrolase [Tistlia consotensis]SMF82551.1 Pimeloyl-ACP methyl ester carboxylesterase [Tistlia consotensis USBA 355]SNS29221.1 Pimeloyl-ACP methyl ester carboxylesterase [Tistlia consotensis]
MDRPKDESPDDESPADARPDDELTTYAAEGAPPLPKPDAEGWVEHEGARLRYASFGEGPPVILLHGGLGHGGDWGHQVPALRAAGRRAVVIDSRGHGRSSRDARPFRYEVMVADLLAVLDALKIERAGLVGWGDGAAVALILAMKAPQRVAGVLFFGCAMDPGGLREVEPGPRLDRVLARQAADYAALSATPDQFPAVARAHDTMRQTQPNYAPRALARIRVPVAVVQAEQDEFVEPEHAAYLAATIPDAELIPLPGVGHFAPLQRPAQFNAAMLGFLGKVMG